MKFVLILIVMLSNNMGTPPSVTAIEFNDRPACQRAAETLDATLAQMHPNLFVSAQCFEKGG